MAALKPVDITVWDNDNSHERYHIKAQASVDNAGLFSLQILGEMEQCAVALLRSDTWKHRGLTLTQPSKNLRVTGPNMKDCVSFIEMLLLDYYAPKVTERKVLIYGIWTDLNYWIKGDGTLAPNGYNDEPEGTGGWHTYKDHTHWSDNQRNQFYSVGLGAWVKMERTYTRGSGQVTLEYRGIDDENRFTATTDPGELLDRFSGMKCPEPGAQGFTVVPYTESTAKFLYESMLALCEMARSLRGFMDDEQVQAALASGNLLGLPTLGFAGAAHPDPAVEG